MSTSQLHLGDCLEVMKTLPNDSVDAIVTDPPYGLSFMGKKWDYDVPSVEVWKEVLRVLKPGGHLLSFAGSRTQHRMCVNIEDAGFEIRDMIAWVYGSGFPKSHNLDGDWKGFGTALKPALEPITLARKPLIGTVAENVTEYGTGALNIDGCRVAIDPVNDASQLRIMNRGRREETDGWGMNGNKADLPQVVNLAGRWPANLIHDGSDEVLECFPFTKTGDTKAIPYTNTEGKNVYGTQTGIKREMKGDSGSAARFFYCAKASKADRGENNHPTVKPTDLMRYLCRLITPPHGTILDPFMGSGSTGKAAMLEGFKFIGIERESEYLEIAQARIKAACSAMPLFSTLAA